MTRVLLAVGGGIFALLGTLHALYTFLDIRKPRRIVPDDPSTITAMERSHVRIARGGTTMWKAWVGFNFSHSIGVVLFGALCIAIGAQLHELVLSPLVLLLLPAISALYLVLALRYWFRIPAAGAAAATACLALAWLVYAFEA